MAVLLVISLSYNLRNITDLFYLIISVIFVVKSSSLLIPLVVLMEGLICGGEIGI